MHFMRGGYYFLSAIGGAIIALIIAYALLLAASPAADPLERAGLVLQGEITKEDVSSDDRLMLWLLGQKADDLTRDLSTDREKAIAIAEWIGTHWQNVSPLEAVRRSHSGDSRLENLIYRTGACGARSNIFVHMARLANLNAKRFSIYNFGAVGSGHTAAQVEWDGKWHFFDVTYAGYFERSGDILSFDELRELGDMAKDHLVVFDNRGDHYPCGKSIRLNIDPGCRDRLNPLTWSRIDNRERMTRVYSGENLAQSDAAGFVGDPTPVTLAFSMSPGEALGQIDGSYDDVRRAARKMRKSEQIERMGFTSVPFYQSIELVDLKPDVAYAYTIEISRKAGKGFIFTADARGCRIISGARYEPDESAGAWKIEIASETASCNISVSHDARRPGSFIAVDRIAFTEISSD
ncbi:MAG: hypothetical protein O3C28_18600 [Proteobacteria bacterium]|nr:hypothetical protein [Pseudomonadota bacterium]